MEVCSAAYRDMYALGLVGDALFLTGGQMKVRNHYIITDSVERWSLKRGGSWLSFAPLPLPLACHCAVSLKEHLYVLGGWTPQVHTSVDVLWKPIVRLWKKGFTYSKTIGQETLITYQIQASQAVEKRFPFSVQYNPLGSYMSQQF